MLTLPRMLKPCLKFISWAVENSLFWTHIDNHLKVAHCCRYECGISKPTMNIQDVEREGIISSCLHFVILSAKDELDELVNGLNFLEILSLIRSNPMVAHRLFVKGTPKPLTADSLYNYVYSWAKSSDVELLWRSSAFELDQFSWVCWRYAHGFSTSKYLGHFTEWKLFTIFTCIKLMG